MCRFRDRQREREREREREIAVERERGLLLQIEAHRNEFKMCSRELLGKCVKRGETSLKGYRRWEDVVDDTSDHSNVTLKKKKVTQMLK